MYYEVSVTHTVYVPPGSVTACVDPLNVFMERHHTLPYLLNMCAQGWVNQIVMTSSTDIKVGRQRLLY